MVKILGIIVVFASVLGGFVLSGGKIAALIHPFEFIIIGGAALGGGWERPDAAPATVQRG